MPKTLASTSYESLSNNLRAPRPRELVSIAILRFLQWLGSAQKPARFRADILSDSFQDLDNLMILNDVGWNNMEDFDTITNRKFDSV